MTTTSPEPSARSGDRPVRAGLASFGMVSRVFHGPLITATPGIDLVAIASSSEQKVHAAYPEVRHHPDPAALIADPDVDLVIVTTPNDTHVPLAEAALAAGKHVVVEKPVALDAAQTERLVAAAAGAREKGLVTSVFHNRRWDGDFLTILDAIDRGLVGRPVSLESRFDRFRPEPRQRWREVPGPGSGLWADLGPHLVDQALVLFGRPEWVSADIATVRDGAQVDDDAHVVLGYDRLRVVLGASTLAARPGPRFVLHGTTGTLVIEGLDPQEPQLADGHLPGQEGYGLGASDATLTTAEGTSTIPRLRGGYLDFYTRLRDAILGLDDAPVTVEEALVVMQVIDAARLSSTEGRRVTGETA